MATIFPNWRPVMWQAQVLQRRHGRMRPADGRTMRPDCHLFSREMGLVHGSAWARRVSPPSRQPHPDGLGSKGPTWTRTRNPVSASSRHEPSILAHRKLRDRSVWRRSPRAMTSRAQCGEACLSSRQAAGPVFTTMESRLRSPMFLLGRVLCAGESEESTAQRLTAAIFCTFRRGFRTWRSTRPRRSRSAGWS